MSSVGLHQPPSEITTGGGYWVPNGWAGNNNIPTSGTIRFSDFYGAANITIITPK